MSIPDSRVIHRDIEQSSLDLSGLSLFVTNFNNLIQIRSNWFKLDQSRLCWIKFVQIVSNQIKLDQSDYLVQIRLNQIHLIQIGKIRSSWIKLVQIGTNWIKSNQLKSKWIKWYQLDQTGTNWINWIKRDQIGPNQIKLVQIISYWFLDIQLDEKTTLDQIRINYTMISNLPKLSDLLIFCIYSINFSLEFFIQIIL